MNLLIVTGLSGAGKSLAMHALEDIGFFCIDNIPANLLAKLMEFAQQSENTLASPKRRISYLTSAACPTRFISLS